MATAIFLSAGDGNVTDDIDLTSGDYLFVNGSLDAGRPEGRYRVVTWLVEIHSATADGMWNSLEAIETKFRQARAAAGAYGHGTRVTLSVKLEGATNYSYFDIVDGNCYVPDEAMNGPALAANWLQPVVVTALCEAAIRGDAVTTTVTGTVTLTDGTFATPGNTGSGGVFLANVPGDLPAVARVTLSDVSTNSQIAQRFRIGSFALDDPTGSGIAQADVDPWIDAAAAGSGTSATDSSSFMGADYISSSLVPSFQRMAQFAKPAAQFTTGLLDVFGRVRDSNTNMGFPGSLSLTYAPGRAIPTRQANGYSSGGSASATITIPRPAPTKAGSLQLLFVGLQGNQTITATGWTAGPTVTHGSNNAQAAIFYKTESASESGDITVTLSGAIRCEAYWVEIVGATYSAPIDKSVTNTATGASSVACTSGVLAQAHEQVFMCAWSSAGTSHSNSETTFTNTGDVYDASRRFSVVVSRASATTSGSVTITGASGDWAAAMVTIKQQPNLYSLGSDTYQVQVVAVDSSGNMSLPSSAVSLDVDSSSAGVILAEWTAGSPNAAVDHYRLYYKRGSNAWEYYAMPATKAYTAYILAADEGTTGDPPTVAPVLATFRYGVALSSGTTVFYAPAVQAVIGSANWEWVYLGTIPHPPMPAPDGGMPRDWVGYLDAAHESGAGTLDVDGIVVFAHGSPYLEATYPGLDLATKRDWVLEQRRDGRVFGYLAETGTDTEAGQVDVIGDLQIGPGDTWLTIVGDVAGGVSDVDDLKVTVVVTYVPRFLHLRGT